MKTYKKFFRLIIAILIIQIMFPVNLKAQESTDYALAKSYFAELDSLCSIDNENEFERHEGMPEYTAYKLCGLNVNIIPKVIAKQINIADSKDGFANSFAYLTGPAYGFLLDELNIEWIKQIMDGKNLPEIVEKVVLVKPPLDSLSFKALIEKIGINYDYKTLIKNESEKFEKQKKQTSFYKEKIISGSQLIIRNNNLEFTYNPQEKLIEIDNGVIYKTMYLIGEWGILDVKNGIYRSNDWQIFIIPDPKSTNSEVMNEDNYVLTLKKGWKVIKIKEGKYTLIKE